ncbi:MAG: KDO2-lipid IV(A) lauroyltransferase, partial [Bacteroidia bacterium]
VGGHFNNWEILAVGIDQQMKHKAVGIYMPLSSPFFDQKLRETRSKFGLHMIPTKVVADFFAQTHDQAQVVIFGADQSPTNTKKVLWTTFLHQETAVALGAERYAKLYDLPVFFGTIHKIKRGYYSFDIQLVTDQPKSTNDGFITEAHVALLEKDIINEPQYWLWTHRRWKRKR